MEKKPRGRPRKKPATAQPDLFGDKEIGISRAEEASQRVTLPHRLQTEPIIEITSQLVEALERGDPNAKIQVEQLLQRYIELYGEAGAANFQRAFENIARTKKQRLPEHIPQQTSQEVRSLAVAISDGHTFSRWKEVLGEVALRHVIVGEPFQVKFTAGAALLGHLGQKEDVEALKREIALCDLNAVLLFYETLGSLILHQEKSKSLYFTTSLDDMIDALGWNKAARQSTQARQELRELIYRWLMVFDGMKVIGMRPGVYRDPDTKERLEIISEDALIRLVGQKISPDVSTKDGRPLPLEVTFVAGPWVEQFQGNRQILAEFGNVRAIARIPSGKPSGAWARCIAMTLYQRWREGASRVADKDGLIQWRPFTRRQLLSGLFKAEPDVFTLLNTNKPFRALDYWDQAIAMLKEEGILKEVKEEQPLPPRHANWRNDWLDQPLHFTPGEKELKAARLIHERAAKQKQKTQRKRGRPRKVLAQEEVE